MSGSTGSSTRSVVFIFRFILPNGSYRAGKQTPRPVCPIYFYQTIHPRSVWTISGPEWCWRRLPSPCPKFLDHIHISLFDLFFFFVTGECRSVFWCGPRFGCRMVECSFVHRSFYCLFTLRRKRDDLVHELARFLVNLGRSLCVGVPTKRTQKYNSSVIKCNNNNGGFCYFRRCFAF